MTRNITYHYLVAYLVLKPFFVTCLCNIYPLYTQPLYSKTEVCRGYLFFLFLLQNIDCGYPQSMFVGTHNLCFEQKYEKYQTFSDENLDFYNLICTLHGRVFVMTTI